MSDSALDTLASVVPSVSSSCSSVSRTRSKRGHHFPLTPNERKRLFDLRLSGLTPKQIALTLSMDRPHCKRPVLVF